MTGPGRPGPHWVIAAVPARRAIQDDGLANVPGTLPLCTQRLDLKGATLKDTRTKSRRRVEVGEGGGTGWGGVEGRGENADNCN